MVSTRFILHIIVIPVPFSWTGQEIQADKLAYKKACGRVCKPVVVNKQTTRH
jgi:hypothetical protein